MMTENLVWWIGWRPKVSAVLFLAFGIGASVVMNTIWGMFLGLPFPALWMYGVIVINREWSKRLDEGESEAQKEGAQKLGIQGQQCECYFLRAEKGSRSLLVIPSTEYVLTFLYVCDTFVAIYENSVYDLANRQVVALGSGTKELYFRHVNSVQYTPPYFELRSSSLDLFRYESESAQAESAVNAIRKRLRTLAVEKVGESTTEIQD